MKTSRNLSRVLTVMAVVAGITLVAAGASLAQAQGVPPVTVHLTFSKGTYNVSDPLEKINAFITLTNSNGSPVLMQDRFSELAYHLYLVLEAPDGTLITSASSSGGSSPTPSVAPPKVMAEQLPAGWTTTMEITEVRDYFPLTRPGLYKAWVSIASVQYDPLHATGPVDGSPNKYLVPHEDPVVWFGTLESNRAQITLKTDQAVVGSDVRVTATEYVFGEGPRPGVTKKPLTNVPIGLYKVSAITAAGISPINFKAYGLIVSNPGLLYRTAETTPIPGEYLFRGVKRDDYVVIAKPNLVTDYKHLGKSIEASDANWGVAEIPVGLILMTDLRGKKPGKTTKVTGSMLMIIEPEYVEWSADSEYYPFAFESVGEWGVTVSVEPPEGFVADQNNLSTTVDSNLKAVQFTITDVGSEWKPTKVTYKLKHKGKTRQINSHIDVKLSKKLADKKRIHEWGEVTDEMGPNSKRKHK